MKKGKGSIKVQMERMLIIAGILFLLVCLYINHSTQQMLLENANEHMMITAQKLENQLSFMYDKMDTFSAGIAEEEAVQQLMTLDFSGKSGAIVPVEEMIAYYKILDPSITDISLVNDEVHYSTVYSYEGLNALRRLNEGKLFSWLGARHSGFYNAADKSPMLVYAREIWHGGEDVGTLLISIDSSYFQVNSTAEMNSYYLLADETGVLLSFNGAEKLAEQIWQTWKAGEAEQENGRVHGKSWYIQSAYSEEMGCYQLSALDVSQVNHSMGNISRLIWTCVLIAVLFLTSIFWMLHVQVVKPLQDFNGIIRQIRTQRKRNLQEEPKLGGCAEIREIGGEFAGMLQDIDQLNRKIFDTATDLYEMKVKKQEAELSYLRSQIDPHFLYNTLEVFRKMALLKDAPEMAQMAVDMGNIFRYSTKGEDMVTLADEISIIKSYIRIQKTRFMGKIEVFYFLPEETLKVPVIKMLLQPLVENAIYHGLEPKEGKGNLFLGARLEEGMLSLTIKDDGVGIETDRLSALQRRLEEDTWDTSRHVGVLNTQARIRLQYGAPFGIYLESSVGDGTTVTVKLPAEKEGEPKCTEY